MVIKLDRFVFLSAVTLLFVMGLAVGIATGGIHPAAASEQTVLPVICYCRVTEGAQGSRHAVTALQLENDLRWLKEHGYQAVTAADLLAYAEGKADLPAKPVMLAFEDGYGCVYRSAMPLLKQYGYRAVLFPVASCIRSAQAEGNRNADESFLCAEEVTAMAKSGIFEVQNHTFQLHSSSCEAIGMMKKRNETAEEYRERVGDDLASAQQYIKSLTAASPCALAYPAGKYGDEAEAIAKEIGLRLIFTGESKLNTVKKGTSDWCCSIGRFERTGSTDAASFFETVGIG